jgi:hypothetical protein
MSSKSVQTGMFGTLFAMDNFKTAPLPINPAMTAFSIL